MKNRSVVLLAVFALMFPALAAEAQIIAIHNRLGVEIHHIYMSDSSVDNWEEDILGDGILEAGETLNVTIHGSFGQFDVLIIDRNGREMTRFNFPGNTTSISVTRDGLTSDRASGRTPPAQQPRQQPQPQQQPSNYAADVVNLTNAERRRAGLSDLRIDNELMAAAAQRARELERHCSHGRPDGRSWNTVLREFRVASYNSWSENILFNMSDRPADAVAQWMNSSGHRANILRRESSRIGVGVHRSGGRTYVVQLFVGR
jgi:uncharacterized protein YkwD